MPLGKLLGWVKKIFGRKKKFRLAIYGLPNAGKTSIANRISLEWTGKKLGEVSELPHETRHVKQIEEVKIRAGEKEITIDLIDVPGISYRKDLVTKHHKTFLKHMTKKEAKQRVREAILGVKTAVKLLDSIDTSLLILDSAEDPYDPINALILGALESKKIPTIIIANKTDLAGANPGLIEEVYPDYPVVRLSTLKDKNLDHVYQAIADHHK